jgi:hypothetical protein
MVCHDARRGVWSSVQHYFEMITVKVLCVFTDIHIAYRMESNACLTASESAMASNIMFPFSCFLEADSFGPLHLPGVAAAFVFR